MAGLGQYGSLASSIINSLNLVKTLTGARPATMPTDQAWTRKRRIQSLRSLQRSLEVRRLRRRGRLYVGAGEEVGSAPGHEGVDGPELAVANSNRPHNQRTHNSVNLTNAALNAQQQQDLAAQAKVSRMYSFETVVRDARRELSKRKTSYV